MKQTGERECELPERETPPEKTLHLIAYHQATHKHPTVQRWLAKYPRVQMRGAPTSASRRNMVGRWFRDITTERLRHGVLTSAPRLKVAVDDYFDPHTNPKPLIWTALYLDHLIS
jgi:hypothetical protein